MRRFPTLLMVLLFLPLHWGCSALQSRMTPSRTLRFSLEDLAGQIEKDLSRSIEKGRGLSGLPPEPLGAESPRLGLYLCDRLKVELGRRGFTVVEKGGALQVRGRYTDLGGRVEVNLFLVDENGRQLSQGSVSLTKTSEVVNLLSQPRKELSTLER